MTLPTSAFVCEGINLEAATKELFVQGEGTALGWEKNLAELRSGPEPDRHVVAVMARYRQNATAIIAAALGETIPAAVEKRGHLQARPTQKAIADFVYTEQRYTTEWQPVTGDSV